MVKQTVRLWKRFVNWVRARSGWAPVNTYDLIGATFETKSRRLRGQEELRQRIEKVLEGAQ